jgi:hypothetical protein
MIKRNYNISVIEDRNYIDAETAAYEKLVSYGLRPAGRTRDFKKVVVVRIENEHSNDEKKEWFYFTNWQEASEALCNKQGG